MWIKFRKKPIVIEAILWDGKKETADAVEQKAKRKISWGGGNIYIFTPEGTMIANRGDWIIKGVMGEFYPCKNNIFELTYEITKPDLRLRKFPA